MYKRLVVVSDTALYKHNNQIFGFAPVVKELELLQNDFEEIIWIGAKRLNRKDSGACIQINAVNIKTILLPQMGGKSLWQITKIILLYPYLFFLILKQVYSADVIHTRLPSHPAFIAVVISFIFPNKIWWNKFAGSWIPDTLPFFYKFQRSVLLKAKHSKVTINGFWKNQPSHCFSFENPCLYESDIVEGVKISYNKDFNSPFTFVFIGRIDEAKGVDKIIDALNFIPRDGIKKVHFIGDSSKKNEYEKECHFLKDKVFFHGVLSSKLVHKILKQSDFLLLPSKSEGFPKVIAEAACYGVIPIVSDVGSIPHYIDNSNGFVWNIQGEIPFKQVLLLAVTTNTKQLKLKSKKIGDIATLFTFENYKKKLTQIIIN